MAHPASPARPQGAREPAAAAARCCLPVCLPPLPLRFCAASACALPTLMPPARLLSPCLQGRGWPCVQALERSGGRPRQAQHMARVYSKAYRSDEPAMTSLARVYAGARSGGGSFCRQRHRPAAAEWQTPPEVGSASAAAGGGATPAQA